MQQIRTCSFKQCYLKGNHGVLCCSQKVTEEKNENDNVTEVLCLTSAHGQDGWTDSCVMLNRNYVVIFYIICQKAELS